MKTPTFKEIDSDIRKFSSGKYIRKQYPEFYQHLIDNYSFCVKFTEKLYCYYHNMSEPPKCPICGNFLKFDKWTCGYHEFCCHTCAMRGTRERAKNTMIERYGGVWMASPIIKEKALNTVKEKYGGTGFASKEISDKIKKSNLDKYGNEIPMKTDVVKNKVEETMLERHGVRHALQKDEFLKKSQDTCESHYGVRFPGKSKEIMAKVRETQIKKYGGVGSASREIFDKIIKTNNERYGRDYGFDYDKVAQTNLERYGCENPLVTKCTNGEIKYRGYSKASQECFRMFKKYLGGYKVQFAEDGGEKMIEVNGKKIYVDFYIDELKTCIEFNGDHWHANPELFGPDDHCIPQNKNITAKDIWEHDRLRTELLESAGVKVITIWASEFKKCKDIKNWLEEHLNIKL